MRSSTSTPDKPTRKSARIVGDVLGKFHPHGDTSVYDAMVRLAQDWSMRYPLVDGQGNFGSMDGDSPAAMRYTEARMKKITDEVMADIDKETVDWTLNFDDTIPEPTVLPTKIPLLIVNGASGIAVGMATNMAPHNLSEVVDACCAYIDNPEITGEEMLQYIKGPDFPTGGIIYGYEGVREAMLTGRGRVMMRAKTDIEHTPSGRECIVITEIPYMINKAEMIKKIADMINEKKIEGISYINDESDRNGLRIIIILKHDAVASVVLNTLFKNTPLQTSFAVNNIALVNGRPQMLPMRDLVKHFVDHRHDVVVRRARFDLKKAEERLHIVQGLLIAQDNIDEIVHIIRSSQTPDAAKQTMIERFNLSDIQASAIIEMRLRALTGLEYGKLIAERDELTKQIAYLKEVLENVGMQMQIIKDETARNQGEIRRRTPLGDRLLSEEFNPEDFLRRRRHGHHHFAHGLYQAYAACRVPHAEPRRRRRQGQRHARRRLHRTYLRGLDAQYDALLHGEGPLLLAQGVRDSGRRALFEGPCHPERHPDRTRRQGPRLHQRQASRTTRSTSTTTSSSCVPRTVSIKKTKLEAYSRPRQNGVNAIVIREGDQLIEAKLTSGQAEVMIAARDGKAIRFNESTVRPIGRVGAGVRGISIEESDEVVGMICVEPDSKQDVLVLSENGYGKRTDLDEYRITNRGGKGVKTINVTEKTGKLISIQAVTDDNDLMIINRSGLTIRTAVSQIRLAGRATQGVRIINLREGDAIASVMAVPAAGDEDEEVQSAEVAATGNDATPEADRPAEE